MKINFYCENLLNKQYVEYDIKHIGYSEDSFVYHLQHLSNSQKQIIVKCFKDEKNSMELDVNKKLLYKDNFILSGLIQPLNISIYDLTRYIKTNICVIEYPYYKYDLDSYIKKNLKISFSNKLKLIEQIKNGIQYLHSIGYYHGDLKPQNICISENGDELKIIDYGLCDQIDNKNTEYYWKNTVYSASPFQIFHRLQDYPDYVKKYYDKYYTIINTKYNPTKNENFQRCKYQTTFKESCVKNDWFGVGLLIYFILTDGKYFFLSSNLNHIIKNDVISDDALEEIIKNSYDFLDNPIEYCKSIKIKHSEYYEKYILQLVES